MSKNPIINALSAAGYIGLVVSVINLVTFTHRKATAFTPVVFLLLLTLSVAVMAFLFFYQPLQLFIAGKKKEGVNLFVRTIGVFAIFTGVVLLLLFSGII